MILFQILQASWHATITCSMPPTSCPVHHRIYNRLISVLPFTLSDLPWVQYFLLQLWLPVSYFLPATTCSIGDVRLITLSVFLLDMCFCVLHSFRLLLPNLCHASSLVSRKIDKTKAKIVFIELENPEFNCFLFLRFFFAMKSSIHWVCGVIGIT